MGKITICFAMIVTSFLAQAQVAVKLKVECAEKDGGKICISIFNSEQAYKARVASLTFSVNSNNETVNKDLTLPSGQYVFSIYQDSNGNGKLDTNLIGIPREKFGFTNYDGKSAPGNFIRHKVEINGSNNVVVVRLYKI
jgi:uncharacterized protein (DUF2141 family)